MSTPFSLNSNFINGGICAAVAAQNVQSVIASVLPFIDAIDVVEVRLDAMRQINIQELCDAINLPLLFTNRPAWEGGAFTGHEQDRVHSLVDAVQHQAAFVDLELKTDLHLRARLLQEMEGSHTRLIISHHNFDKTPGSESLSQTLRQQAESGAHIGKIVTMAHDHFDVLRVLNLQNDAKELKFPLIAFCMGEAGRLSRIITLLLGGFMTYAALDDNHATAPGQLSIKQIKTSLSLLA